MECDANPSIDTWTAAMERSQLGDPTASHSEAKSTVSESACKHEPSGTLAHGSKLVAATSVHPATASMPSQSWSTPSSKVSNAPGYVVASSSLQSPSTSVHPSPSESTSNRQGAGPNTHGDGEGFTAPSSWHPDNVPGGCFRARYKVEPSAIRTSRAICPSGVTSVTLVPNSPVSAVPHPISVLPLARRMALPWAGA